MSSASLSFSSDTSCHFRLYFYSSESFPTGAKGYCLGTSDKAMLHLVPNDDASE